MLRIRRSWCETADSLIPIALGDLVDAELPRRQGIDDADARRIAEDAEHVGERLDHGVVAEERGG